MVIVVAMLGTATKLQTARNIKVKGSVNGNADFDGSGNLEINTTVNFGTSIPGSLANGEVYFQYFD